VIAFIKEIETRKNNLYKIVVSLHIKKLEKHFILNMFLHLIVMYNYQFIENYIESY